MSQVHYKFKSSKDYDSTTFDGHSISVFDLKKEILIAKGLKGPDDLQLTHAESGEEYYDDATLIPRNTSVLVARVPAKPGRGGAQRYLEGSGPIPRGGGMTRNVFEKPTQGNSNHEPMGAKMYKNTTSLLSEDGPPAPAVDTSNMTEEERMKFVFEQSASYWEKTQDGMASAPYRPLSKFQGTVRNAPPGGQKPGAPGAPGAPGGPSLSGPYNRAPMEQQQRPPPNTYVCYRCGKKGDHWIQFCPTNNDKSFEPIGIKKTTGIPRSFLKTVESDSLQSKKGVMVTQDGNLVVATTNDYEWKKFHEKSKGALTSEEAFATAPIPDDMKCPICHMLLKNAVRAPCCGTNFCDECIRNYLVQPPKGEEPFHCQHCRKHLVPDQLIPNIELRQRVEQHVRDWAKNRGGIDSGRGATQPTAPHSRGGTPSFDTDGPGTGPGSAVKQESPPGRKPVTDNDMPMEGAASAEIVQKRRMSNDAQDSANGGDHDRDQSSWKNKKPYNSNHTNNNYNQQNFNRNRQPMMGPGGMGPMDPALMFPDGMMQDPTMFMDPAFFGPNGVPPFMMPGFIPPFGPEFGGMPVPGGQVGGPGPEMWAMGRGMPGLPPMGPGFPTPRIGFTDGPAAGRGRGRGNWQEQGNNMRGPGQNQQGPQQGGNRPGARPEAPSIAPTNEAKESPRRSPSVELPTGPASSRPYSHPGGSGRLSIEDDEEIPKGPRAGPGPDFDRRSESPPTAPLADRIRNRSGSRARSERADHGSDRDRDRDSGRDKERTRDRDRDREHRDKDRERRDDRSRSSRYDRERDDRRSDRRDDRRDSRREDRRDDRRDDRRGDRRNRDDRQGDNRDDSLPHHHHRSERPDRESRQEHGSESDQNGRQVRETSSSQQWPADPQREYDSKRRAKSPVEKSSREEVISFKGRSSAAAAAAVTPLRGSTVGRGGRDSGSGRSGGRRGYGRDDDDEEEDDGLDFEDRRGAGRDDGGVVEEIRFRKRSDPETRELSVSGLVSSSARERERQERERRGMRG
ncbi:E3 ubiquitin-protein ligase rbbp6 [Dissophora globulifera]|uniref:E3 ubiquitin-protein ligase rbbp6 n=1 Tax=Dissophora globulifera TaxID=979702 RepID=A0A9P6UYK3_9FUNG|nr:E3 ubiquitin-protein ligase rbbp6 [Dissophora globulifera]